MIRSIFHTDNRKDFDKLTECIYQILDDERTFKYLSYSMVRSDRNTIEEITKNHKKAGLEYIICEEAEVFAGVSAVKKNTEQGFELFLLAVRPEYRCSGLGQNLIDASVENALSGNFRSVDTFVFSDNKNMLRLLMKNDFMVIDISHHMRADGMDLLKLRRYL
jgi:ribosomal protein S18 acetylase RimI-like enzyme